MTSTILSTSTQPIWSEKEVMRAVEFYSTQKMVVNHARPKPKLTDATDAIIKVTATTVCGSDLHMYHKTVPVNRGDILGHEAIGIVESVGTEVKLIKPGMRVVISAVIADGKCEFCLQGRTSLCDTTNPSENMRKLYGSYATSGIFGYSELTGSYPGTQAEFVRVPIADVNLLPLPESKEVLSDELALLLSDVACTAWHGNELAEVRKGDSVCVWGAGPVGLLTAYFASYRGASKVVIIDCVHERLALAKSGIPNCDVINFREVEDLGREIKQRFVATNGPNKGIDCVGFRYPKTWKHTLESMLSLEQDSTDIANEVVLYTKKGGNVALIGDYFGYGNHFAIGPYMEKNLTMRGGQVFVHAYWKLLLDLMVKKEIRPDFIYTHRVNLEAVPDAYEMFDKKKDGMIKVIVRPFAADI